MVLSPAHMRTPRRALATVGAFLLAGCTALRTQEAVPGQTMEQIELPGTVAMGTDYGSVLKFRDQELREAERHLRRMGEIEDIYVEMVEEMYPDGIPMPQPDGAGIVPETPPMPELTDELKAEWERLIGSIRWRSDRTEKAFRTYIGIHPEDWSAMNDLGEFLYDNARGGRAVQWWLKALEVAPEEPELHNNLGCYYSHTGEPLKAIGCFRKAIELKDDVSDYHLNLATLYFTARHDVRKQEGWDLPTIYWKCQNQYERAFELDPTNFERARNCYENYAMAHLFEIKPEDFRNKEMAAIDRCLAMELTDPQRVSVLTHKGRTCRKREQYADAEKLLTEAVDLANGDAPVANGLLHKVRRQMEKAKNSD